MSVFALFGNPVRQSLSPLMHRAALRRMGLDGHYVPLCIRHLPSAVQGLRGMDLRGVSVTLPFKQQIMEYLDEVDDEALRIGAVNTVVNDGGRLTGHNTDWLGLVQSVAEHVAVKGKTVLILGTGGTARAALFGVMRQGGHPVIIGRNGRKSRDLARDWNCPCESFENIGKVRADMLIHTTPVGMFPRVQETLLDRHALTRLAWVVDVIYNPLKTRLLHEAEAAGCRILSGLDMFVYQGAEQIRLWTGQSPPVAAMRRAVLRHLTAAPEMRDAATGGDHD